MSNIILVTGGAGYVGAVLVPQMLKRGYHVKVLDLFIYGDDVLEQVKDHPNLEQIKGDIRNQDLLQQVLPDCDAVIHLACISNDPSFDLDPQLGTSINYDAFTPLIEISKVSGVRRFIYASSSSVYDVKEVENVDETTSLEPLTDYSKYKALCGIIPLGYQSPDFTIVILRSAAAETVHGATQFMPIPVFRPDGYLPEGLHLATFEEVAARFGTSTPHRRYLLSRLQRWVELARAIGASHFLVDGSFVTQKPTPGDVDAVVWLPTDFEVQVDAGLPAAVEFASMIETRQPEEIFAAANEWEWQEWVEFFSQTREPDGRRKGIVEVQL